MNRMRPGAKLTDRHREVLREWLFKEKITYREAQSRLAKQFKVKVCINTLHKFYKRIDEQRTVEAIATAENITFDSATAQQSLLELIYSHQTPGTLLKIHKLLILAKGRRGGPSLKLDFRRATAEKILRWATDPRITAIIASPEPETTKCDRILAVVFPTPDPNRFKHAVSARVKAALNAPETPSESVPKSG